MLLSILRTVGWLLEKRKSRNQKQQKVITWPAAPGRAGPCDAARPSAGMGFARSIPGACPQKAAPRGSPVSGTPGLSHRASFLLRAWHQPARAPWLAGVTVWVCWGALCLLWLAASQGLADQRGTPFSPPFPIARVSTAIACTEVRLCRHSQPYTHINLLYRVFIL